AEGRAAARERIESRAVEGRRLLSRLDQPRRQSLPDSLAGGLDADARLKPRAPTAASAAPLEREALTERRGRPSPVLPRYNPPAMMKSFKPLLWVSVLVAPLA